MIPSRRLVSKAAALSAVMGLVVLGLLATARTASAELTGACTATLNGVNVATLNSGNRANDIRVSQNATIPVVFTTTSGFASHQLQLEFAGRGWPISQKADNGAKQFTEQANVAQYAQYGVGLYKLIGVGALADGTSCSGAATIDVAGNPLETTAGQVAAGAVAVGTVVGLFSMAGAAAASPARDPNDSSRLAAEWYQRDEEARRRVAFPTAA